jgi:hypothetical protein
VPLVIVTQSSKTTVELEFTTWTCSLTEAPVIVILKLPAEEDIEGLVTLKFESSCIIGAVT